MKFARRSGLPVAVRGGGHSFPGHSVCDGGVVIDLGPMKGIRVDPERRTVRAQAGVQLGELDRETQAFGLVVPSGIVTSTGIAGLTLGGGIGWVMRKFGLSIDNLLSVDVVTADGEFVKASEDENADLFWGVRGGGGNFGIVTEFEFRAHPLGPIVVAGPVFWPMEESPKVLRFYRDWIAEAPDELMTIVVQRKAPPLPFVPAELHGKLVVAVVCCYAGPVEEGERVVQAAEGVRLARCSTCACRSRSSTHQSMFDASFPKGWWYYMRACDVDGAQRRRDRHHGRALPAHRVAVDGVPDLADGRRGRAGGGRRVGVQRPRRGPHVQHHVHDRDGRRLRRGAGVGARASGRRSSPTTPSVYVNFLMDEGEERVRQAYGDAKYDRLKALKRRYDPDNLFRLNQNIPPG